LVAAVTYRVETEIKTSYYDFVSPYLSHNELFYGKCLGMLLTELKEEENLEWDVLYWSQMEASIL
jgi:hypothetical protein